MGTSVLDGSIRLVDLSKDAVGPGVRLRLFFAWFNFEEVMKSFFDFFEIIVMKNKNAPGASIGFNGFDDFVGAQFGLEVTEKFPGPLHGGDTQSKSMRSLVFNMG
jgi:hypothetical protein